MPTIPIYRQQTGVSGLGPSPRASASDFAGGLARHGDDIASATDRISAAIQARQEEDAKAWVIENLPQMKLDWMQNLQERKANVQPGAPDFTSTVIKEYDTYTNEAVSKAPSKQAGRFLQEQLRSFRMNIADNAIGFEAGERVRFQEEKFFNGINSAARLVQMDTGMADTTLAEQRALIDAMNIPPANKDALRAKIDDQISYAAGTAIASNDPQGWLDYVAGKRKDMPVVLGLLTPQQVNALTNSAESQIKTQGAAYAQAMRQRIEDSTNAYYATGHDANPLTQAEVMAAFPNGGGEDAWRDYQRAQDTGAKIAQFDSMSNAEIIGIVNEAQASLMDGSSEDFTDRQRDATIISQAAARVMKRREDDPVAAIMQNPAVQKARAAMEAAPQDSNASQAYFTTIIAEQERIGVLEPMLLSSGEHEQIAAIFRDPSMVGAKMVDTIGSLQEKYGRFWPDVYRQLGNDMPAVAFVIGSGSANKTASVNLAMIAGMSDADLFDKVPSDVKTTINEKLLTAMVDYQGTFAFQKGGMQAFTKFNDQVKRLAFYYVSAMKKPPAEAVRMARDGVFDGYTIGEMNGMPFRAPKDVDADEIVKGAGKYVTNLISTGSVMMPPEMAAVGAEYEDFLDEIEDTLFLTTSDDERGAVIMYKNENGMPGFLTRTNGDVVVVPWKMLSGQKMFFDGAEFIKAAE